MSSQINKNKRIKAGYGGDSFRVGATLGTGRGKVTQSGRGQGQITLPDVSNVPNDASGRGRGRGRGLSVVVHPGIAHFLISTLSIKQFLLIPFLF